MRHRALVKTYWAIAWLTALAVSGATAESQEHPGTAGSGGTVCHRDSTEGDPLELRFLDVGQGDAALIRTPDDRYLLIDGGRNAAAVSDYLVRHGIDTIVLVIASHNHADHIGGFPQVVRTTVVGAFMENGVPATTSIYHRLVSALEQRETPVLVSTDRVITIDSTNFRILAPAGLDQSQNNNSVGVVAELGVFRALFLGDAERSELDHWLQHGDLSRMTVVKVSHHGSANGTTSDLVTATSPLLAIVSVGAHNQYGHPGAGALALWLEGGADVLRTDEVGEIVVCGWRSGLARVYTEGPDMSFHEVLLLRGDAR